MSYPGQPPTADTEQQRAAQDRTMRLMSLAIIGCTVFFGVAMTIVLGIGSPNLLWVLLAVLLVVAGFMAAMSFGYRPVAAVTTGPAAYLAGFFRRLIVTDAPALLNLAIGFVIGSALPYLVALPFSIASMAVHLYPTGAARRRWEANQKL